MLLGPGFVRRAASAASGDASRCWMLTQPRPVRESFVSEVIDNGGQTSLAAAWMLRQPREVRESYIREVLGG